MRKKTIIRLVLSVIVPLTFTISSCVKSGSNSSAHHYYQLKLKQGQTWNSQLQIDLQIESEVFGQSLNSTMGLSMDYAIKALAPDQEANRIQMSAESAKLDIQMASFGDFHYNSDSSNLNNDDQDSEMFDFIDAYIGKSVEFEMDNRARILRIEGEQIDTVAQIMDDSLGGMPDFRNLLGEDLMKKFSSFFAVLPPDSVEIGESWETELFSSLYVFPLLVRNTFTLQEVGKHTSVISVESKILLNEDELLEKGRSIKFPVGDADLNVVLRIRGTQTGTIEIENKSGWTVNSQVDQQLEGEIQGGIITLPVVMKNSITYQPQ